MGNWGGRTEQCGFPWWWLLNGFGSRYHLNIGIAIPYDLTSKTDCGYRWQDNSVWSLNMYWSAWIGRRYSCCLRKSSWKLLRKRSVRSWKRTTHHVFLAILLGREYCHKILICVPSCKVLHECLGIVLRRRYLVTGRIANRDNKSTGWRSLEEICDSICRADCRCWIGCLAEVCYVHIIYKISHPIAFVYMLSYRN